MRGRTWHAAAMLLVPALAGCPIALSDDFAVRSDLDAAEPEGAVPDANGGGSADAPTGVESGSEADPFSAGDGPRIDDGGRDARAEAMSCLFYLDQDGDGFGGTITVATCTPSDGGSWVTVGGDCDDQEKDVFPGQAAYFAQGYTPTGSATPSFDYDCSGAETEKPPMPAHSPGSCGTACNGVGYLPVSPARTGSGVDVYCGSTSYQNCAHPAIVCLPTTVATAAIECH